MTKENNGLFTKVAGPFATVRGCNHCKFADTVRHPLPGRAPLGRGNGLAVGSKAYGRMIQHAKESHPTEYAAWRAKGQS